VIHLRATARFLSVTFVVSLLFLSAGCATRYSVGYALDPLDGPPVKFKTPVLVRTLADLRPVNERFEPLNIEDFRYHSVNRSFKEPVAKSITRALQLELANAGVEVADAGNFIIGEKPYLRVVGKILNFVVTRQEVPVDTMQHGVKTLWGRERFTVKVSIHVEMIDTLQEKRIMARTFTSSDSIILRSDMIDSVAYETGIDTKELHWQTAGNEYCIQLLNEHLKRVLVEARNVIVRQLTPGAPVPETKLLLLDSDSMSFDTEISL